MMDYWGNGYSMWGGGGIIGLVFGLLFLVLVVAATIALVRYLSHDDTGTTAHRSVENIINERYAKGEITKAQFEEMKKDIKS